MRHDDIFDEEQPKTMGEPEVPELEGVPLADDEPNEEELATLRRVSDTLPWRAFLVAVIELCERFTYYGTNGPFQV